MPPKKGGKVAPAPAVAKKKGGKGESWEDKANKMEQMKENLQKSIANRRGSIVQVKAKRKARRKKGKGKSRWRLLFEKVFGSNEEIKLNRKSKEMVAALMITEDEVRDMKRLFEEVDLDGAGEMDFDEFFELIGEHRTPFTDSIFTIVDDPGFTGIEQLTSLEIKQMEEQDGPGTALKVRGHLTFDDFLQVVCTFCMYGQSDLVLFCFNAFDADNSGVIDENEFMQLCVVVNNQSPTYPDNFKLALSSVGRNDDGMMSIEEFADLNEKFPIILFPLFKFQDQVMRKLLGPNAWKDIARRVQEEREIENYKRTHDGKLPPLTLSQRLANCFKRQKKGRGRARKPPSAKDTAMKKAATMQSTATQAGAEEEATASDKSSKREARGAGAVGRYKLQNAPKRVTAAAGKDAAGTPTASTPTGTPSSGT